MDASTVYDTVGAHHFYYAQFAAESYTITWDLGDGKTETTQQTYGTRDLVSAPEGRLYLPGLVH